MDLERHLLKLPRNTSRRLGEREIEVGTRARRASVSTLFRDLPNVHECFYNVREHQGENVFHFVYKITRRKLRCGNSLLCQSVNSPYWRESFHVFHKLYINMAFSQSKLTFSKCYFINTDIIPLVKLNCDGSRFEARYDRQIVVAAKNTRKIP